MHLQKRRHSAKDVEAEPLLSKNDYDLPEVSPHNIPSAAPQSDDDTFVGNETQVEFSVPDYMQAIPEAQRDGPAKLEEESSAYTYQVSSAAIQLCSILYNFYCRSIMLNMMTFARIDLQQQHQLVKYSMLQYHLLLMNEHMAMWGTRRDKVNGKWLVS